MYIKMYIKPDHFHWGRQYTPNTEHNAAKVLTNETTDKINTCLKVSEIQGEANKLKSVQAKIELLRTSTITTTKSILRTPPNVNTISGKRPTTPGTSPEMDNKRYCEDQKESTTTSQPEETELHSTPETEKDNKSTYNMEAIMENIFESLEKIQEITSKTQNGISRLEPNEKEVSDKATTCIYKSIAMLTLKIGQMEQENLVLRHMTNKHSPSTENTSMTQIHAVKLNIIK